MKIRNLLYIILLISVFLSFEMAIAGSAITLGGGLTQDQNSLSNQSQLTNYVYGLGAYAPLSKGEKVLYLGAEYLSTNISQYLDASTTATLTSTDFMMALKFTFLPKELLALTVGFSPYTKAQYKVTALSEDTWYGTSYMTKFSIQPDLGLTKLKIAASLMYYHAAYTQKNNSESTTASSGAKQSFNRSLYSPTLELIYKF